MNDKYNSDSIILKQLEDFGSDLGSPMIIDFHLLATEQSVAEKCYDDLVAAGYVTRIFRPDAHQKVMDDSVSSRESWLIEVSINMLASVDKVHEYEEEIQRVVSKLDVVWDGWASYGNGFSKR